MSKSVGNERSRILISDTKQIIVEKCAKALSDSQSNITYEPEKRPAISNLVSFAFIFRNVLQILEMYCKLFYHVKRKNAASIEIYSSKIILGNISDCFYQMIHESRHQLHGRLANVINF